MTHNEQDVERVSVAIALRMGMGAGSTDDLARAALDAMGPREAVSREQVDEIVHGILGDTFSDPLTDRIVSDLHDAILALLQIQAPLGEPLEERP